MNAYDMAKKYYPERWSRARLEALVEAGKLTPEEFEAVTGEPWEGSGHD